MNPRTSPEVPPIRFGPKLRELRRSAKLSQAHVAKQLAISASYLNLIENDRRPLPAPLLVKVAQLFQVDLRSFAPDEDMRLLGDLYEAFSDSLFEEELNSSEVRELVAASPACARAVLKLYRAYQEARTSTEILASRLTDGDEVAIHALIPSEEVNELIQRHGNYFPALEQGAEELWRKAKLSEDDLYPGLVRYLDQSLGVQVRVAKRNDAEGFLRRYDPERKVLTLSELLPTRSRNFQIAAQIGLMTQRDVLNEILQDRRLTADESRNLARMALANYFAGAILMPYEPFLRAALGERYDIDVLGRRFRVGFEQVCHRLTTLRRPGDEGVPFHMIRIDVAGNISKRFSASGIHFARFSGACPRWNVFSAFLTPGMIRIQSSRMPDGVTYFCIARTIQRDSGGYHMQHPIMAIGLGCRIQFAREMVYSDGVDLKDPTAVIPVGVTCRVCERDDCEQRAFPSLRHPLRVDENVRRLSLYSSGSTDQSTR